MTTTGTVLTGERADLLEALGNARFFLRHTVQGLDDQQARVRTTASELTLGGLIKHVASMEVQWRRFIVEGPSAMEMTDAVMEEWPENFRLGEGESLRGMLDWYAGVAEETDELARTVDLDLAHPLPAAPWFEAGAKWSARRVLLHIAAETAQHAGHADIIRESLDGQKSMG